MGGVCLKILGKPNISWIVIQIVIDFPIKITNCIIPRGSKVWTICMHLGMHALRASDHAICGLTMIFTYFYMHFRQLLISDKFRQSMGNSR